MTDKKLDSVMNKMETKGPEILSNFEHKGIYGDVEAFRERNPEWKLSSEDSESEGKNTESSGIIGEMASTSDSESKPAEKIKKIKELHDEGILTDKEFQEKKNQLLDEI